MKKTLILLALAYFIIMGTSALLDASPPRILIRFTAARAIQQSAVFLSQTRLTFSTGEQTLYSEGGTEALERAGLLGRSEGSNRCQSLYNRLHPAPGNPDGMDCHRNWLTPEGSKTVEEYQGKGLLDTLRNPLGREDYVRYSVVVGRPVVEVTGILKEGHNATVDFDWRLENISELGTHLIIDKKGGNLGHARFVEWDDGWRITNVDTHWVNGADAVP